MTTYGCVIVSRNDNYGGSLKERASYAINSCIETYDEVIYVDWNSKDRNLIDEIEPNLLKTGKLKCITVSPDEHVEFTRHFQGAQPCSEVLGRNVGLRRLSTDFFASTNIDDINPERHYLESLQAKDAMTVVARHGVSLQDVVDIGEYKEISKLRGTLKNRVLQQAWAVTREPYSLVEWCGDLQIAHRDLWYGIKAFEETQLGIGVHDSYVQRKAVEMGYITEVSYDIPFWHINHNTSSDYNDGSGVKTDTSCLFGEFSGTTNDDNWGKPDYEFTSRII